MIKFIDPNTQVPLPCSQSIPLPADRDAVHHSWLNWTSSRVWTVPPCVSASQLPAHQDQLWEEKTYFPKASLSVHMASCLCLFFWVLRPLEATKTSWDHFTDWFPRENDGEKSKRKLWKPAESSWKYHPGSVPKVQCLPKYNLLSSLRAKDYVLRTWDVPNQFSEVSRV